jgi:acyl-CoA thioesterase YciA
MTQTASTSIPIEPRGELASRTLAMPANTNPRGDIFGGWIMSLMDAAGAMTANAVTGCSVATVAVSNMAFLRPVEVGDAVCCYTDLVRIGRTSIALHVEIWVLRQGRGPRIKVTEAEFTFVALDESGAACPITRAAPEGVEGARSAHKMRYCSRR